MHNLVMMGVLQLLLGIEGGMGVMRVLFVNSQMKNKHEI